MIYNMVSWLNRFPVSVLAESSIPFHCIIVLFIISVSKEQEYLLHRYFKQEYFSRLIDSLKDGEDFVLEEGMRRLVKDQMFIREANVNDDDDETAVNSRSKNVRREKWTEEKLLDILQHQW